MAGAWLSMALCRVLACCARRASGLVALTKIAFMGWGVGVRDLDFTGISGHAMVSSAVLPVALFVACLPGRQWVRAFGVSAGRADWNRGRRVADLAECPFSVGSGDRMRARRARRRWCSWRLPGARNPASCRRAPVAVSLAMVAIMLHGISVPTQRWITDIALHLSGREQPYIRARWKAGRYDKPVAPPSNISMCGFRGRRNRKGLARFGSLSRVVPGRVCGSRVECNRALAKQRE